ncbi:MAG TPA: hypothetical protein VF546_16750 [Pyrinomonadaceae bacterium]|jgi:hypothetical protein
MKDYGRKTIAALVFALALTTPALADDGIMYPDRTPPGAAGSIETESIIWGDAASVIWGDAAEGVKQVGLGVLQELLSRR